MRQLASRLGIVICVAVAVIATASVRQLTAQDPASEKATSKPNSKQLSQKAIKLVDPAKPSVAVQTKAAKKLQEFFPEVSEAERRIQSALADESSADFLDSPLSDVADFLAKQHDIPIIIDVRALEDEGIEANEPVSKSVAKISLESLLKVVLADIDLTYEIRNDVLYITTRSSTSEHLTNRVYPVADLVTSDEKSFEELVNAIQETTETFWLEVDGDGGTISVVKATASVSVLQSYQGHKSVLQFLRSMRQSKAAQEGIIPKLATPKKDVIRQFQLPNVQPPN